MTDDSESGLFGIRHTEEEKRKALERMLEEINNPKPKQEILERGRFNLDKLYGSGTYIDIAEQIQKDGLLQPTIAETTSLIHDAFFDAKMESKYQKQIQKIMKDKWFWTFTGILYVPNKGAYIQDNPEIRKGNVFMEESELVKKLQKNDKGVRFVPFGYKTEDMTPSDFEKNAFVIGLAGKEGAKKLADVAGKYKENPYLWSFKSINEPTTRVSAVVSYWNDDRLYVSGGDGGDNRSGCVFGVRKKAGGASPR